MGLQCFFFSKIVATNVAHVLPRPPLPHFPYYMMSVRPIPPSVSLCLRMTPHILHGYSSRGKHSEKGRPEIIHQAALILPRKGVKHELCDVAHSSNPFLRGQPCSLMEEGYSNHLCHLLQSVLPVAQSRASIPTTIHGLDYVMRVWAKSDHLGRTRTMTSTRISSDST